MVIKKCDTTTRTTQNSVYFKRYACGRSCGVKKVELLSEDYHVKYGDELMYIAKLIRIEAKLTLRF